MKKILAFPIAIASTFAVALPAFADTINTCPPGQFNGLCNLSFGNGLIGTLITFAFVIAIILALAWLIYGGIRWILSQGDKGKVDSARQHIIAALIGLIIVFLSYFLLNIVLTFFGIPNGISGLKIPTIAAGQTYTNQDVCNQACNDAFGGGTRCLDLGTTPQSWKCVDPNSSTPASGTTACTGTGRGTCPSGHQCIGSTVNSEGVTVPGSCN